MTITELLNSIETHLFGIVGGTPLAGKVATGRRKQLTATGRARVTSVAGGGLVPMVVEEETTRECLHCSSGLFLFYNDATVVRWPQVAGPVANSLISIETGPPAVLPVLSDNRILLKSAEVAGFKPGVFTIDVDGRLIIHPTGTGQIDIVVLGNPGGEWGSNTNC